MKQSVFSLFINSYLQTSERPGILFTVPVFAFKNDFNIFNFNLMFIKDF